jgi:hypothetical protein
MTAVEFLLSKTSKHCFNKQEIDQAKAMEKEQLKEIYLKGIENYDPTFKKK